MYGAPISSNGRVVPRPSDMFASNRHVPGQSSAVSGVGMFGLGTQVSPVSSYSWSRFQFFSWMTWSS